MLFKKIDLILIAQYSPQYEFNGAPELYHTGIQLFT